MTARRIVLGVEAGCKNANDTMPNPKTTATSKCRETEDKKQVVAVLKGHGECRCKPDTVDHRLLKIWYKYRLQSQVPAAAPHTHAWTACNNARLVAPTLYSLVCVLAQV
jgi:hypothetical protein